MTRTLKLYFATLVLVVGVLFGISLAKAGTAYPWHVRPAQIRQWQRVHRCEGDAWTNRTWGGLGIAASTWSAFRLRGMPLFAYLAKPRAQIRVGLEVVRRYGMATPDQNGCAAW